jgi:hypothetical protein
MLKVERVTVRAASNVGVGRFADRRRQAQIAARRVLQQLGHQLRQDRLDAAAVHAAELQLPEAWLPFVVSR